MIDIKESEMVELFLSQHNETAEFYKEVPVYAKSVDLVKNKDDKITAIEFKTTKWRKAASQALGSAIAFDFLEICVLKPATLKCQNLIKEECENQGLGLYFLDAKTMCFDHIVLPVPRKEAWEIQKRKICEYLQRRNGSNE